MYIYKIDLKFTNIIVGNMSTIPLSCKYRDNRCSTSWECIGQLYYLRYSECYNCIWYLFTIGKFASEKRDIIKVAFPECYESASEQYKDVRENFNHYRLHSGNLTSPICKYRCVNCRIKFIFENCHEMILNFTRGSKLRYYAIHIKNSYNNIEIPLNHKSKYNWELDEYIRSSVKIKIRNHDYHINLNQMFILHLKILRNFGNLPSEIAIQIMLLMVY